MTGPIATLRRRVARLLGDPFATRDGSKRSPILAFFPSRAPVKCPECGRENPAGRGRCQRCGATFRAGSGGSSGSQDTVPFWLLALGLASVVMAFWLGNETGRAAGLREAAQAHRSAPAPTPLPAAAPPPTATLSADPLASAAGATWAIYASRDRLSDRPLFGARFGTLSGTPLFSVLCAEGQGAVSLTRGLLPATEGASGNARGLVSTLEVAVRTAKREHQQVELRFEESAPELLGAMPAGPLDFLNRVAASRRIRTASDDFDPTSWGDAIARVIAECRFDTPAEERPAPRKARARRN